MARIRSIKPEFPQSETIGRLSRDARLLFIQLWTFVDDSGRARAASRALASLLYPYDDDVPSLIEGWLAELEENDCIRRYEADGKQYLDIPNWLKHQKIDRPSRSRFPEFVEPSRALDESSRGLDALPRTLDLGSRILKDIRAVAVATRPVAGEKFKQFWEAYPKRDGANPKAPAEGRFFAAVRSGIAPEEITAAAGRYAVECRAAGLIGTPHVAQAMTWLGQRRWSDYPPPSAVVAPATGPPIGSPEWRKLNGWPEKGTPDAPGN